MSTTAAEVIEAIKFLPTADLLVLAAQLKAPASAPELQRRCEACPETAELVRRFIFCPARSRTPPRRIMKALQTPPAVVRPTRRPEPTPPRRLRFFE